MMDAWGWVSVAAGVALCWAVVSDVYRTTLHADLEGRIASAVQRAVWRVAVAVGRRWRRRRRRLLALAGPLMVVLTFAAWVVVLVAGVALVVWPNLGVFRSDPEFGLLGFLDAVYYAGITVTVLGYGDITPLRGPLQLVAFGASATGFAVLTGAVTYVIELVNSLNERHRLTLRVGDETGGSGRGSSFVVRHVAAGSQERLAQRFDEWAALTRNVQDQLQRFAVATLYYRSQHAMYDPEPTFRILGEAIAAGYLTSNVQSWQSLRPAVEHLDRAYTRLMLSVAAQYLAQGTMDALTDPEPAAVDEAWLTDVAEQVRTGTYGELSVPTSDPMAVRVAARQRVFLVSLAGFTHWHEEHEPLCRSE